jgi:hypothetical protein
MYMRLSAFLQCINYITHQQLPQFPWSFTEVTLCFFLLEIKFQFNMFFIVYFHIDYSAYVYDIKFCPRLFGMYCKDNTTSSFT